MPVRSCPDHKAHKVAKPSPPFGRAPGRDPEADAIRVAAPGRIHRPRLLRTEWGSGAIMMARKRRRRQRRDPRFIEKAGGAHRLLYPHSTPAR
jgi:hypothetical protein